MNVLITACLARSRSVLLVLLVLLLGGAVAFWTLPREANPEVEVPFFLVSVVYPGISAGDAERLLLEPLEQEVGNLGNLRRMEGSAGDGFALLQLEFEPGADNRSALADLRARVDTAEQGFPADARPVVIREVDLSLFPVLTVTLSGPVDERLLIGFARQARDRLEALPGVLEVVIGGEREEMIEVIADPLTLESYRLGHDDIRRALDRNNLIVAAGAIDTGVGRVALQVPGLIRDLDDVRQTTVRATGDTILTVADVADVRRSFQDPDGFARVDGQGAVSLEIRKESGANIIATVAAAQAELARLSADWPGTLELRQLQNSAEDVAELLGDLQNNVLLAMILVLLTLMLTLHWRAAMLVAFAIPASFLTGLLGIAVLGFTLNIVVLFALILVVGMLVDASLVVTELADRYRIAGRSPKAAFAEAATRMAWPVTASVATTLAVFLPLLFWPGFVGRFLVYLPATVILTLLASLLTALLFVPVLGALLTRGGDTAADPRAAARIQAAETGSLEGLGRWTRGYVQLLRLSVLHPAQTLIVTIGVTLLLIIAYAGFGRGLEFFPDIEPDFLQVQVQARGNLSVREADALVRQVEAAVAQVPAVRSVYARTIGTEQQRLNRGLAEDVVGVIQLDLVDWRQRPPADTILEEVRAVTRDLPGVRIAIREQERGPGTGLPVHIEVSGQDREPLRAAVAQVRAAMDALGGFVDASDDRPVARADLQLLIDRSELGRFGTDVSSVGLSLKLLTDGVALGSYRPIEREQEEDIRLRYPVDSRSLSQLVQTRILTADGLVPIANLARIEPVASAGLLRRVNGEPTYTISADVESGQLVDERVRALQARLAGEALAPGVRLDFGGETEDQSEAAVFLIQAFGFAVFLMALVLVTQFNRIGQTLLVLSAIVFSTVGVLLGLLLRAEAFSVVMSGVGVLALAGIVVNNNIVLLDRYNELRRQGLEPVDAALRTGAQRLRPVILTAGTTVLGLLPMVLGLTVDLVGRDVHIGAPSTQFWVQLASAISGGLLLATPITLLFTPAMAVWLDRRSLRA